LQGIALPVYGECNQYLYAVLKRMSLTAVFCVTVGLTASQPDSNTKDGKSTNYTRRKMVCEKKLRNSLPIKWVDF
jgi:hypothetical protein